MSTIIQKKRLTNEVKLLKKQPLHYCTAYPDESNPLIWYFLIKGQKKTDYHTGEKNGGGEYIGKIVHSPKYPAEPPDYYMLTPSGRFSVGIKICNTNSRYHKSDWSSTWNILSILIAFYSIMLDDKEHGIGHIKDTTANRKKMAKNSVEYNLKNNATIYSKFDRTYLKDDAPKKDDSDVKKDDNQEINQENSITDKNKLDEVKNLDILTEPLKVPEPPKLPENQEPEKVNKPKKRVLKSKTINKKVEKVDEVEEVEEVKKEKKVLKSATKKSKKL